MFVGMSTSIIIMTIIETRKRFLRKLKTGLPDDAVITLLWIYPEKIKSAYERIIYTPMLTTAELTIAKKSNQAVCPST